MPIARSTRTTPPATILQRALPSTSGYGSPATPGMLGYLFWAAEYPSARRNYTGTVPPSSCEGGMGAAATTFNVPVPMPVLRQH